MRANREICEADRYIDAQDVVNAHIDYRLPWLGGKFYHRSPEQHADCPFRVIRDIAR